MANEHGKRCLNPPDIRKMTNLCWDTNTHTSEQPELENLADHSEGCGCQSSSCPRQCHRHPLRVGHGEPRLCCKSSGCDDTGPKLEGAHAPSWWPDKQLLSAHTGSYSTMTCDLWLTQLESLSSCWVKEVRHESPQSISPFRWSSRKAETVVTALGFVLFFIFLFCCVVSCF